MKFCIDDIVKATRGDLSMGDGSSICNGISIDSRAIEKGNLFVAIKGAHFDGHNFIDDALSKGAAAVLLQRESSFSSDLPCVQVDDAERSLGDIAAWWRSQFNVPCVAITGSNGKSTTKEMIAAIAGVNGDVLKTEGNFNNLIGLPLTIFRWNESHKVAILEMGMNAPGEIERLTEIAKPKVGLITNVTSAHLEKLHTLEAVARAKGELFSAMDADGIAVVNEEDPWVMKVVESYAGKRITFGMKNESNVRFLDVETDGLDSTTLRVSIFGDEYEFSLPVPGTHNIMNAMAALAIGCALKIEPKVATERLSKFKPMAMRFEQIQLANGVRLVNDSYNANPASMKAAFRTVGSAKRAGRFIVALGDMLELGEASYELHKKLGEDAARMGVNLLLTTGDYAEAVVEGAVSAGLDSESAKNCSTTDEIEKNLEDELKAGDVLLVKGSRGMRMERIVETLKHSIGTG
jgi:UDP-N-acetylmuramoyl-tripeptide--D-alanyl-D-alanine ligase